MICAVNVGFRHQKNVVQNEIPKIKQVVTLPVSNTALEMSHNLLIFTTSLSFDDPACDAFYCSRTDFELLGLKIIVTR
jgi:hypothetical protein